MFRLSQLGWGSCQKYDCENFVFVKSGSKTDLIVSRAGNFLSPIGNHSHLTILFSSTLRLRPCLVSLRLKHFLNTGLSSLKDSLLRGKLEATDCRRQEGFLSDSSSWPFSGAEKPPTDTAFGEQSTDDFESAKQLGRRLSVSNSWTVASSILIFGTDIGWQWSTLCEAHPLLLSSACWRAFWP